MIQQLVKENSELSAKLNEESANFKALEKHNIKLTHSFHECSDQVNLKQKRIENLKKAVTTAQDEVCA